LPLIHEQFQSPQRHVVRQQPCCVIQARQTRTPVIGVVAPQWWELHLAIYFLPLAIAAVAHCTVFSVKFCPTLVAWFFLGLTEFFTTITAATDVILAVYLRTGSHPLVVSY